MGRIDSRSHRRPAQNSQPHLEERPSVLAGPHRAILEPVLGILANLKPASAPILLAHIHGVDWSTVDSQTRLIILHEIDAGIIALRERSGLVPFDDPFPGDRANVFHTIKKFLFPAHGAMTPGL